MLASVIAPDRTGTTSSLLGLPRALPALSPAEFEPVRRAAMLRHCKWDAQVGDLATLAPFAITIDRTTARQLNTWSEALAAEALAAEAELLSTPSTWDTLAVPRAMKTLLRRGEREGFTPAAGRAMRFDFHPTTESGGSPR